MFCPKCGTEASSGLAYCRSCGLSLGPVGAVLDARLNAAVGQLASVERVIRFGLVGMAVFVVTALFAVSSSGPFDLTVGPVLLRVSDWGVSLMLALLAGMPLVAWGYWRLRKVGVNLKSISAPNGTAAGERSTQLVGGGASLLASESETRRAWDIGAGSEDPTARLEKAGQKDQ
jgi:hypothetical protein